MIRDRLIIYEEKSSLQKKCFCCKIINHFSEECPLIQYIPHKETIIKNFIQLNKKKNNFLRKNTEKTQTLLNLQTSSKAFFMV